MLLNLCKKTATALHYRYLMGTFKGTFRWNERAKNLLPNCERLMNKRKKQLRRQVAGDYFEQKLTILKKSAKKHS